MILLSGLVIVGGGTAIVGGSVQTTPQKKKRICDFQTSFKNLQGHVKIIDVSFTASKEATNVIKLTQFVIVCVVEDLERVLTANDGIERSSR